MAAIRCSLILAGDTRTRRRSGVIRPGAALAFRGPKGLRPLSRGEGRAAGACPPCL